MRGVAADREVPQGEHELVAVRPDQRDPPLELGRAHVRELGEQRRGEHLAVAAVRHARSVLALERAAVRQRRGALARRHLPVGGGDVRVQRLDERQPGAEQLRAGPARLARKAVLSRALRCLSTRS